MQCPDTILGRKVHPAAKLFPFFEKNVEELVTSCKANGYMTSKPIIVMPNDAGEWAGAIIDGCHRGVACERLGIEPTFMVEIGDPWEISRAANSAQRGGLMTRVDWIMAAYRDWRTHPNTSFGYTGSATRGRLTAELIAKRWGMFGVKRRHLLEASTIEKKYPEVFDLLVNREVTFGAAVSWIEGHDPALPATPSNLRRNNTRAKMRFHILDKHKAALREKQLQSEKKQLLDRLVEAEARMNAVAAAAVGVSEKRIWVPRPHHGKTRNMTAIAMASDWHVEETVDPRSVAGVNAYTMEIAQRRVERFFDAIIWNIEHQRASARLAIDDLLLWIGGDIITGYIHKELMEANQASPLEAIRWVSALIASGVEHLADHIRLRVICDYGNHGRTGEKKMIATGAANSFEYHMYCQLAKDLAGVADFFVTPSAHHRVEVYGYKIHTHHGDDVKGGNGIGGLAPPLLRRVAGWDAQSNNVADYHLIGHFHRAIDFGNVIVNGSMIGYGPYAQYIGAPDEPPCQQMFYIDEKRGKTMLTPLWVGEVAA